MHHHINKSIYIYIYHVIKSSICKRIIMGVSTILDRYNKERYSFLARKTLGIVMSEVSPTFKGYCYYYYFHSIIENQVILAWCIHCDPV